LFVADVYRNSTSLKVARVRWDVSKEFLSLEEQVCELNVMGVIEAVDLVSLTCAVSDAAGTSLKDDFSHQIWIVYEIVEPAVFTFSPDEYLCEVLFLVGRVRL